MPEVAPTPTSLFPERQTLRLCTANVCTNGHEWVPNVALARCGYATQQGWNGCGAPVLMVKVENCPQCNEPVKELRFRSDETPPTPFVIPLCIPGSTTNANVTEVVLPRNRKVVEEEYDKKFPPLGVSEPAVQEQQGETN